MKSNDLQHSPQNIDARNVDEIPVNAKTACAKLGWCSSYMGAVKRAMGIRSRYFFLSDVRSFIRNNPGFTSTQIYHRPECKCPKCQTKKMNKLRKILNAPTTPAVTAAAPLNSRNAQTTNPVVADPFWNREVFARKMRILRGERSLGTIATKAGLSREVVRRTEGGEIPKLGTLRQIATAAGASEEVWLELVTLWLKTQAGESGAKLRIEILGQSQSEPTPQESPQLAVLVEQLRTLNSSQLQALLDLARSKQRLEGLCSLLGKNPPENEYQEETQPVAGVSELSTADRMSPRDDLWVSLG